MTKQNRIEYLVCTLSIVVTGFLIYGFLGCVEPLVNDNKFQSFLVCLLGGLVITVISLFLLYT